MDTFKDRLSIEETELHIKIEKLGVFVTTDAFDNINTLDRQLMTLQLSIMKSYQAILNARLAQLNKGK